MPAVVKFLDVVFENQHTHFHQGNPEKVQYFPNCSQQKINEKCQL